MVHVNETIVIKSSSVKDGGMGKEAEGSYG